MIPTVFFSVPDCASRGNISSNFDSRQKVFFEKRAGLNS